VLVFAAEDPVFGGGACRVRGCTRAARSKGMCPGHHLRWVDEGHPDPQVFAATTDHRWRRQRPNAQCQVAGCGYGAARGGMCQLHGQRWDRAGRPDLHGWLADPPTIKTPAPGVVCAVAHCDLWPQAALRLCHAHANTWKVNGRPEMDVFVRRFEEITTTAEEIIRLDRLGPQLRLEIQYVLQCRHDQRATKTLPGVVMALVRALAATGVVSLLDRSEAQWRSEIGRPAPRDSNLRALLIDARRKVDDLADADGWEGEFDRNVWQMRRLGFTGNQQLDFTAIPLSWLRDLVKRWLRWRLTVGLGLEAVRRGLRSLTRFALFCQRIGVTALAEVDRVVLERYLADLYAELAGRQRHGDQIGQLNSFLHAVRQHHWDDTLSATALIFSEDYPARVERAPRALAEQVMAPDRAPRQPRPVHQPGLPAGHPDPDPGRVAGHRRIERVTRLRGHRRRRRPLPALSQPQDETRGAGPDRRTAPRPDRRAAGPGRGGAGVVPAADEEPRPPGIDRLLDLPARALSPAGLLRCP
jgi:hypothetical protein